MPTTATVNKLYRAIEEDREVRIIEDGTGSQREGRGEREWVGKVVDLTGEGWPGWFRIRRTDGLRSRPPQFSLDALRKLTFVR